MTLTTDDMLVSLRFSWSVTLTSEADQWCLRLYSERHQGTEHTYRGADLARVVARAWAGERGDRG